VSSVNSIGICGYKKVDESEVRPKGAAVPQEGSHARSCSPSLKLLIGICGYKKVDESEVRPKGAAVPQEGSHARSCSPSLKLL